jgi:choline kinase
MGGHQAKTLIPLGEHRPLLYYLLAGLESAGISDVLIITGFQPKELQDFVEEHASGLEIAFVRNTRYASWGNFHSLRLAIDQSPGRDLLVANSDVIVNPDVYNRVASSDGDLVLAIEKRSRLDEEDMRVELRGRTVQAIGKHLKPVRSHGEFAGISLLRPDAALAYSDIATEWEWLRTTDGYYEDIYAQLLGRVAARAAFVEPGEYAEVDTPEDVPHAVDVIERHRASWSGESAAPAGGPR